MELNDQHLMAIEYIENIVDQIPHAVLSIAIGDQLTLREAELMYLGAMIQEGAHTSTVIAKLSEVFKTRRGYMQAPVEFHTNPAWQLNTFQKAVEGLRIVREKRMASMPPIEGGTSV